MRTYRDVREDAEAALRTVILDAAGRILTGEGPASLTMRRIAAEVGCSTTVLYKVFQGKEGIADGLFREGFRRLLAELRGVPRNGSLLAWLDGLRWAYRNAALSNPDYYQIMFASPIPSYKPSPEARELSRAALAVVADAAEAAMQAGVLEIGDPWAVAETLWAAAHGAVSLELAGYFSDPQTAVERFRQLTQATLNLFRTPGPHSLT